MPFRARPLLAPGKGYRRADVGAVEDEYRRVEEWQQDRAVVVRVEKEEGERGERGAAHLERGYRNRLSPQRPPGVEHCQEKDGHHEVLAKGRVGPVEVVELQGNGQHGAEGRREREGEGGVEEAPRQIGELA